MKKQRIPNETEAEPRGMVIYSETYMICEGYLLLPVINIHTKFSSEIKQSSRN